MSIIFTASDVRTGYKNRPPLLKGLNLEAKTGNVLGIIGANGSGKSTLLRTFSGLQKPECGKIHIAGSDLYSLQPGARARLVATLFPDAPRYSGLRVAELVELGRYPHSGIFGKLSAADHKIVEWAMEEAGCSTMALQNTDHLSDGELQKVMMARLLAQQTAVMILDEPTNFLDLPARISMFKLLRSVAAKESVIIFSSHDIQMTFSVADQLLFLDGKGGFVMAPPSEMASHKTFLQFLPPEDLQKFVCGFNFNR